MEWLVIGALVVIAFLAVTSGIARAARKAQERDPDAVLDGWFDGRDQVIVDQSTGTLTAEAILAGANTRGYRCVSTTNLPYPRTGYQRMIFEKQPD